MLNAFLDISLVGKIGDKYIVLIKTLDTSMNSSNRLVINKCSSSVQ